MGMEMGLGSNNNLGLEELPGTLKESRKQVRNRQTAKQKAVKIDSPLPVNIPLSNKSAADIQKAVAELEGISLAFNRKFKFKVDYRSSQVTVKVIDPETDKVIKELSSIELQRLRDRIRQTIGILFDEQV